MQKIKAGGARKGAGRKPRDPLLKKNAVSYRLPQWLINWMAEQEQANSILIENALTKQHKLKPPK